MRRIVLFALVCSLFAGAAAFASGGRKDVDTLLSWMSGNFTSRAQAEADADYRDIRLAMVPIWKDRADGPWLYVEQAVATAMDAPYRQRVYHLTRREDGAIESAVYTLKDPKAAIGAWRSETPLAGIGPDALEERTGCAVILKRRDERSFAGSTAGTACSSDLRGASYATSEVTITAEGMTSWDRGFDAEGKQVWGAEKGPYQFRRER